MAYFCSDDFAVWQARASLKLSIDIILCIELKQSYCEILESVSAVLAKISWNFHPWSLSASHRIALTRERKNSSRIAREIEIFSIFAWLVPTLVPKHNSRFWVFRRTICWSWWSINIYETFCAKKIAVSLRNVVSAPCSETGPDLRTTLFVDPWLLVTKLCT